MRIWLPLLEVICQWEQQQDEEKIRDDGWCSGQHCARVLDVGTLQKCCIGLLEILAPPRLSRQDLELVNGTLLHRNPSISRNLGKHHPTYQPESYDAQIPWILLYSKVPAVQAPATLPMVAQVPISSTFAGWETGWSKVVVLNGKNLVFFFNFWKK